MASPARAPMLAVREAEVELVTPTFEQIALRVYEIWRREGEVQGKDRDHWFQAIAELASGTVDDDDEEDDAAVSGQRRRRFSGWMLLPHSQQRQTGNLGTLALSPAT